MKYKANKNTVKAPKGKKVIKTKGKAATAIPTDAPGPYKPTAYFSDKQIPGARGMKIGQKVNLKAVITGTSERADKDGTRCSYDVEIGAIEVPKGLKTSKKNGNYVKESEDEGEEEDGE